MCGENPAPPAEPVLPAGSSPRVRGKRHRGLHRRRPGGLIPACARKTSSRASSPPSGRAHPRVCGENAGGGVVDDAGGGSSPRVRGKPDSPNLGDITAGLIPACAGKTRRGWARASGSAAHPRVCGENLARLRSKAADAGLIPACAGKTSRRSSLTGCCRAHPRVCGENSIALRRRTSAAGSSPRVRGKPTTTVSPWSSPRLIPACAGKTRSSRRPARNCPAHPRVCGENSAAPGGFHCLRGSSPRVRGKPGEIHKGVQKTGLIPACAGKTEENTLGCLWPRAHPRVCGENATSIPVSEWEAGSSPRVRGKRRCLSSRGTSAGLIPACAGKTRCRWRRWRPRSAHPRVCGENNSGAGSGRRGRGSSPRVRGKRRTTTPESLRTRLIPACAGKTRKSSPASGTAEAHPRVCGENTDYFANGGVEYGSSPRVRGKRADGADRVARRGLIPACAGKTPGGGGGCVRMTAHPRVCGENVVGHAPGPVISGSSPRVRGKLRRVIGVLLPSGAHPRVCGENRPRARARVHGAGSSPRVRGKPPAVPGRRRERGLIPACAGKTGALPPGGPPLRAHPRVCGENRVQSTPVTSPRGSSPRVRGKPGPGSTRLWAPRLIPACAGKTCGGGVGRGVAWAHPRVCGENRV